jgi:hypothetical protein
MFTDSDIKNKNIAELLKAVKVEESLLKEILLIGNTNLNKLIDEKSKLPEERDKEDKEKEEIIEAFRNIKEVLELYCDWKKDYYVIVTTWIIGTYFHEHLLTYPYLYFNASKESGKSRAVRLITHISKEGEMVNSLTEAVLFRTKGTIGIDEFEKASRKGNENLLELLNSAYKRGVKIKRMKRVKTPTGEDMVVESFDVFRPIVLANIWGMDSVLEDRVLPLYLEKTTQKKVSNLLEIWENDTRIIRSKAILTQKCSLCNVVTFQKVYVDWNEYTITNYSTTGTNNYIKQHLFEKIRNSGLSGRMLELSFPLILVADMISEKVTDELINSLREIHIEKNQEAFLENKDVLLIDMISQKKDAVEYTSIKYLAEEFRQFLQSTEEWINEKWVGRAVKRLMLAKEKKRTERGVEVILDIEKARDKIRMFKGDEK